MKNKSKKTDSYAKLKAKWYKKLADGGFVDIERDEHSFKNGNNYNMLTTPAIQWVAKEEYYRMATHFLNEHNFDSELDKVIWEYHTNGISMRNIVLLLAKVNIKRQRDQVWRCINRLEQTMKGFNVTRK